MIVRKNDKETKRQADAETRQSNSLGGRLGASQGRTAGPLSHVSHDVMGRQAPGEAQNRREGGGASLVIHAEQNQ